MRNNTVGFLMGVYNEEGRIRECLDYHLPFFDEVVISVQKSEDKTLEICQEYQAKSDKPFYILDKPKVGFSEKFLQEACDKLSTEWVLYCDADEKFDQMFLRKMHGILQKESFYNGFRFPRHNYFDIQVFNEAVPIEPKVIRARHPAHDDQVRLTRRSFTVFPPQIHVRARVRDESGDEKIKTLDFPMFHLKTLDEQWIDNKSYVEPTEQVKRFEIAKKEAKEKGLPIDTIKLEDC